eukprot:TRINITY_DN2479_c0_g1_i1.p1 TRINITY_DN2479_c0_g1~~TRINITY_DN2479_c0_g1_i1.p1  ORF type:complete len:139 (-),score=29.65 TRINITY_DN2479_c0_g1_i1:522-938(-)
MSNFWKSFETVKNAVQEGVKEFQQEVQQGVQALEKRGGDISTPEELQEPTPSSSTPQTIQPNQIETENIIGSQKEADQQLDNIVENEDNWDNDFQIIEGESNATSSFQPIVENEQVISLQSQLDSDEMDDQGQILKRI